MKKMIITTVILTLTSIYSYGQSEKEKEDADNMVIEYYQETNGYSFEQTVILSGTLKSENYENANGGTGTYYVLILNTSIDVAAPTASYEVQKNVKKIQINFDWDKEKNPKAYLNKIIKIKGDLYNEQTIHDHLPVVLVGGTVK